MTMARVPSDPAQVIVNHASFRVQLGPASARAVGLDETVQMPVVRRRAPVMWSGHSAPELTRAIQQAGASGLGDSGAGAATQVLPRIDETAVLPAAAATVVGQRAPLDEPMAGYRGSGGYGGYGPGDDDAEGYEGGSGSRSRERRADAVRHAYYPHRRMNLGIVLLPLRVFLGFVSIYAGMGKLCDRVYFDGGERGSMVKWLSSLHPWAAAEPLRDIALNHPVGAGLSIAFLQVVVGVLTVFGLWQRVAAAFGATLSIALLVTVSWRTVPVYDAPDFIYLAAWSPLIIAGAPVYSIDGHLTGDAWRRLGPRVTLWDLRRRVLRRGTVLATVIVGLTLLTGSVLGAAVRASSARQDDSRPPVTPTNNLPGAPLPEVSGGAGSTGASPKPTQSGSAKAKKEATKEAATQSPTTTSGSTHSTGSTATTGSAGGGTSTAPSGTGSGGTGGGAAPTQAPPPTTAQNPAPSQPTAKPTQGAIGGLLGSGPLLGLAESGGSSPAPRNTA
jgi:uncharacterized membrane protein YphA (DoxX/SURF4 family)